jgi:molybdopterin converting factor subunit 1
MRFKAEQENFTRGQFHIRVLLFARARELHGDQFAWVPIASRPTVAQLRALLAEQIPALDSLLQVSRIAVNQDFADDAQVIKSGDEVAVIPPVSGG